MKKVNEQIVLRKYNVVAQPGSLNSSAYRLSTIPEQKECQLSRMELKAEYLVQCDLGEYAKDANYRIDKEYSLNVKEITQHYLRQEANRLQLKVKDLKDIDSHLLTFLNHSYQDFLDLVQKRRREEEPPSSKM